MTKITAEHIRHAQTRQLARLLKVAATVISQWTHQRSFNDQSLEEGVRRGVAKAVLVAGIEARRRDAVSIRRYQRELQQFLAEVEGQESAVTTVGAGKALVEDADRQ